MMIRSQLATAAAFAFAGCSLQPVREAPAEPPPPPQSPVPGQSCSESNLHQFIGRERSPALESEMRRVSGAKVVRWVPPGTAITMDYSGDRLTVSLDSRNWVERLSCG